MDFLLIRSGAMVELSIERSITCGLTDLTFRGTTLSLVRDGVFFEWLMAPDGSVVGLEICVSFEEEPFATLCSPSIPKYVERADPFPRIWFSDSRDARPTHHQDWELYVYGANGALFVFASLHMLDSAARERLIRSVG